MARIDYSDPTEVAVGGAQNLSATNELPVDIFKKTFKAFPAITPMLSIFTQLSTNPAHNYRVDWQEEQKIPSHVVIATTEASAGTTIYVAANGPTLVVDTLLVNPRTYDVRIVGATPTTNTVTVAISQGDVTSTVWKSGDVIHVLPPALAENDETYRNVSVADENVYNLLQLVKMQYGITRVMDKITTHFGGPGSKRQQLKEQKYREFREKSEKLIVLGNRATGGTAPATKRMMGGLLYYLYNGTLFKDFNGICTESGFRNYLGDFKDQNPDAMQVKAFIAGNVMDIVDGWGGDKVRLSPASKTYGLDIWNYKSRGLQVQLIPMPLFTDPVTRGWGFLLDTERIKLRYLNRPTFFPEAKNVGMSEIIYDTYRQVISLLVGTESRHSMFIGALL